MKTNCYKDVDLSYIPYRAKNSSKLDALIANYGSSVVCCSFKKKIKEAEGLLFTYNSERSRMAPFFYGIAKCARKMAQGTNLKGIAVVIPHDEFNLNDLTDVRNRMIKLLDYFKRRVLCMVVTISVTTAIFAVSIALYSFMVISQRKLQGIVPYIFSVTGTGFLGVILTVCCCCSGVVMISFVRRLRCALGEKWLQSFIDMSSKVQYAGQKDKKYFYNILEGTFAEVDRAYRITGAICKINACQNIIDEEIPKKGLYQTLSTK